jgi:hypothetical protein
MAKTFILSDESINDRGYRILTSGINLERFKKNPVMLWMHRRDDGWDLTQVLPIGIWENIRKEEGKLLADAKFDENDKFAQLIKSKVENDLIRGCSAGINPVEFSSDAKDLEKGQTRATITKCEIYEASIVDMPSNKNTVRLFSGAETAEVPLIKNNTEMAEKKDEAKLTFKSEAEMLTFMKEKFGLEPKVETPEAKPEETEQEFKFKSEDDARNWIQKLFGLQPKAKETEKKEELKTEKVATEKDSERDEEIAQLKATIENLKKGPGAEDLKSNQETDGLSSGVMEELLSDEDIKLFNSVKQ